MANFKKAVNLIIDVTLIIVLGFMVYFFHNQIYLGWKIVERQYFELVYPPCSRPIKYSIGQFDNRFNISQQDFMKEIDAAAEIWNTVTGKQLFEYSAKGDLKINLIYDYRQETTDKLKLLGIDLNVSEKTYQENKVKLEEMQKDYDARLLAFKQQFNSYQSAKNQYDSLVDSYTKKGGVNQQQFKKLEEQRIALNDTANKLNQEQDRINSLAKDINNLLSSVNRMASQLNLEATKYNQVGAARGGEYEEGLYIQDGKGTRIEIYEFGSIEQLRRVLAHELGHALGLAHVDDPDSIMYQYNQSKNEAPTFSDISAVRASCGLK